MASPAITARVLPTGIMLDDGFPTVIAFALNPSVNLWEMSVKPPGVDGGDPKDLSTMHQVAWRRRGPRKLKTLTDSTFTAGYDPKAQGECEALVNKEGAITIHWPDGGTRSFFGFLQKFEPNEVKEGEPPTAQVTIVPTNWDPVNHVEAGPVDVDVPGT
jgi:hypothetical protein